MKSLVNFLVFTLFIIITNVSFAQNNVNCKVIYQDEIGIYQGECKKGLAHGEGVFTFNDGQSVYEGKFRKGNFHGIGTLFTLIEGNKKVEKQGVWKKNEYIGDKKIPAYDVKRKYNLDRYLVRKRGEGNNIWINFFQNGSRNNVRNLNVFVSNGVEISGSFILGYNVIKFPVQCTINYRTTNKLKTTTYEVSFDIEINEPGEWDILLYN